MKDTLPAGFDAELYEGLVRSYTDDFKLLDNVIAFTWTPDPSKYNTNVPSEQYKSLLNIIYKTYKCLGKFLFIPELNLNGNVHLHGIFTVKDKIKFYKSFLPKYRSIGYVLLKDCYDIDGWTDYLCEDIAETSQILHPSLPIPLHDDNCQTYKDLFFSRHNSQRLRLQFSKKVFKRGKAYDLQTFFNLKQNK